MRRETRQAQRSDAKIGAMQTLDRITVDPGRMNGQPRIRDLRITVRRVLDALAIYPERVALRREYPELDDEDIRQALAYRQR